MSLAGLRGVSGDDPGDVLMESIRGESAPVARGEISPEARRVVDTQIPWVEVALSVSRRKRWLRASRACYKDNMNSITRVDIGNINGNKNMLKINGNLDLCNINGNIDMVTV